MIKVSETDIEQARKLIASGEPNAVGYRLMIKPIESKSELDDAIKEQCETLAKAGFIAKTEHQKERESRGTHHGILVHVGPGAFKGDMEKFCNEWPQEGDIVIFDRYAGFEIELPPGSGDKYRFVNDETILGVMK